MCVFNKDEFLIACIDMSVGISFSQNAEKSAQ